MHECIHKEEELQKITKILEKLNKSFVRIRERNVQDITTNIECTSAIQEIQKALLINYKLWKEEKESVEELKKYAMMNNWWIFFI